MKRIEAIIASEKISELNAALKQIGVGGCTILDAKGRGKGEKPMVEAQRGTARFQVSRILMDSAQREPQYPRVEQQAAVEGRHAGHVAAGGGSLGGGRLGA